MNEFEVDKFAWQRAIFELRLPPITKLTAMVLSVYANKDGSNCHPGIERLANDVGISPRRLPGHLRTLRDVGVIELVKQGGGRSSHRADEYRLTWSNDTAALVDELPIRRTQRPVNARDTEDVTADESSDTTDADAHTTDADAHTTDAESYTTDAAASPHQADNTSHLSPGIHAPFGDSLAAPASPSPDDQGAVGDVEYDDARRRLALLAPGQFQQLLDEVNREVGDTVASRDLVVLAAQRVAS